MEKRQFMFIRLLFISLFLLTNCQSNKDQSISEFTSNPIISNPESSMEGMLVDIIHDSIVKLYFNSKKAIKLTTELLYLHYRILIMEKIFSGTMIIILEKLG